MKGFSLDHLTDTEFEEFCYDLLVELGFKNVNWRKGTGFDSSPADQGRDIECHFLTQDVDGSTYLERWFVQCKHYKAGVPPEKLEGAIAWANAERPEKVAIIVSNFLSNPAKNYLETYQQNNRPSYRIKVWERPDLERLAVGKTTLLRKYKISGEFPFLAIMHPAHLLYLKRAPLNTWAELLTLLDQIEPKKRDSLLSWAYMPIIRPRYRNPEEGDTKLGDLRIDELSYDAFKRKCTEILASDIIDERVLSYFVVSIVLQFSFSIADTTSTSEVMVRHQEAISYFRGQLEAQPEDREKLAKFIEIMQQLRDETPERTKRNYELYEYFCEKVVKQLLASEYI
jgi:hypothetical protein